MCNRWYIGVRSEKPDDKNYQTVIEGKTEKNSGLKDIHVVYKENHQLTIDAWTLEYIIIKEMLSRYNSKTFNKCLKFGLGPIPKDIKNQKHTVTLIRGRMDINGYRAYERLLPDTIEDLLKLVNAGQTAEEKVVKYVDKLVSTWSPKSVELQQYEYFIIFH